MAPVRAMLHEYDGSHAFAIRFLAGARSFRSLGRPSSTSERSTCGGCRIKALLGMLARLPWGRRDVLGSTNGKYEGVSVKYASLIVSCHWIKVFITA